MPRNKKKQGSKQIPLAKGDQYGFVKSADPHKRLYVTYSSADFTLWGVTLKHCNNAETRSNNGNFPNIQISISQVQNIRCLRVLHPLRPALSPQKWLNTLLRQRLRQIRTARRNVTFLRRSAPFLPLLLNSPSICMCLLIKTLRFQAHQWEFPEHPNFHFSGAKRPIFAGSTSIATSPFALKMDKYTSPTASTPNPDCPQKYYVSAKQRALPLSSSEKR